MKEMIKKQLLLINHPRHFCLFAFFVTDRQTNSNGCPGELPVS